MNKHTLEQISRIYFNDIKINEEVTQLLSELKKQLLDRLKGEDLKLFDKYMLVQDEIIQDLSFESFKQGFRASIILTAEVFN